MTRFLLSLLALFALIAAPVGMRSAAAEAMTPAVSHCDEMGGGEKAEETMHAGPMAAHHAPEKGNDQAVDCMVACAALPALIAEATFDAPSFARVEAETLPIALSAGMHPEAATPPPRSA